MGLKETVKALSESFLEPDFGFGAGWAILPQAGLGGAVLGWAGLLGKLGAVGEIGAREQRTASSTHFRLPGVGFIGFCSLWAHSAIYVRGIVLEVL